MTNMLLSDLRFIKADKMYLIFVCGILPATKDFALWSIEHPGVTRREVLQGASHYIMNNRINFTHPNHQLYKPEEVLELINDGCENAIAVEQFLEENNRPYLFWRMYNHRTETGDRGQLRTTAELGSWFLYYKRMYQLSQFDLKVDVHFDNFARVIKHNDERDSNRYIVKQNGKYMMSREFFTDDFRKVFVYPWDTAVVEAAKLKGGREIEIEKERKKWQKAQFSPMPDSSEQENTSW